MIGNVNVPGASAGDLANKVDKVIGKGLSTNDFTDAYKTQLDNMSQSSTGGTKSTIVCSMTQPQNLKNGLWIKTDSEKDIKIISDSPNLYDDSTVEQYPKELPIRNNNNSSGYRCSGACCLINEKFYFFGNNSPRKQSGNSVYINGSTDIECYDPSTDTIEVKNAHLQEDIAFACCCAVNGKAYIFGGIPYENIDSTTIDNNYPPKNTIQCYNPANDTIVIKSVTLPYKMWGQSCCEIDGKIYIFGGLYNKSTDTSKYNFNGILCYDPSNDTITTKKSDISRFDTYPNGTSCCAVNGKAYIFGGCYTNWSRGGYKLGYLCYDPSNNTITESNFGGDPFGYPCFYGSCVYNDEIYLFGGLSHMYANSPASGNYYSNSNTIYKVNVNENTKIKIDTNLPFGAGGFNCGIVNGKVYLFAGFRHDAGDTTDYFREFTETYKYNGKGIYACNRILIYNLSSNSFETGLPSRLAGACCCAVNGKAYIFGGQTNTQDSYRNKVSHSILEYNPQTNKVATCNTTIAKNISNASCCEIDGKIYIFGGLRSNEIQCYDPVNNTIVTKSAIIADSNSYLYYSSCCAVNGKAYIFCGTKILCYDPLTDMITNVNSLPEQIFGMSCCAINDDIYIFGGASTISAPDNNNITNYDTIYCYKTKENVIYKTNTILSSGVNMAISFQEYGMIVIIGAKNVIQYYDYIHDNLIKYDVLKYKFPGFNCYFPNTYAESASCIIDGKIYIFGGNSRNHLSAYGDDWEQSSNIIQKITVLPTKSFLKNNINILTSDQYLNPAAISVSEDGVYDYKNILNVMDVDSNMNATNLEFHPIENYQAIDKES